METETWKLYSLNLKFSSINNVWIIPEMKLISLTPWGFVKLVKMYLLWKRLSHLSIYYLWALDSPFRTCSAAFLPHSAHVELYQQRAWEGRCRRKGVFLPGSWSLFLVPAAPSISSSSVWGGTAGSPPTVRAQSLSDLTDPSPDPVTPSPLSFHCRHLHSEPQAQNRVSTPSAHSLGSPALGRKTS